MTVSTVVQSTTAATEGLVWNFQQLAGPRKSLLLGGWSAPFGRPRQGALLNAGTEVRTTRTDYAGVGLVPTIHEFGTKRPMLELKGRWMDRTIPATNGAQDLRQAWNAFVEDRQIVRMSWGGILSYQIFLTKLDLMMESGAEIAWAMKAEVLVDEQSPVVGISAPVQTPLDIALEMQAALDDLNPFTPSGSFATLGGILSEVQDAITSIQGQIDAPFASIFATCSALSDFETALSADLAGMGSGLSAIQTSIMNLRSATDYLFSGAQLLNSPGALGANGISGGILTGETAAQLAAAKQTADLAAANLLALIASFQGQLSRTTRGTVVSAYVAKTGDTWESIGIATLGGPDAGRAIRAMNGIAYGQAPVPGRKYSIPSSG